MQGEKRQPYEEDIRVPLIVRGPGVKSNSKTDALALSIDLVGADFTQYNLTCKLPDYNSPRPLDFKSVSLASFPVSTPSFFRALEEKNLVVEGLPYPSPHIYYASLCVLSWEQMIRYLN